MLVRSFIQPRCIRSGAVTAWLLITLPVIIGIVAIGMDGGRLLDRRRQAQATADAAALADEKVQGMTEGKQIVKVIAVPDKLINIVVK